MTVGKLADLLDAEVLSGSGREAECGFMCDVLSVSMAKGARGMAWITCQANMNALAVAVMRGAACLVFPNGMKPEQAVIERAEKEGIGLLTARAGAFELAGRMWQAGLGGEDEK